MAAEERTAYRVVGKKGGEPVVSAMTLSPVMARSLATHYRLRETWDEAKVQEARVLVTAESPWVDCQSDEGGEG